MTLYGTDVSSWQTGIDMSRVAAARGPFRYNIAKATEGSSYRNPAYQAQKNGTRAAGMLFMAYHYVTATGSARTQVDNYAAVEPDKSVPVMLDHENGSGGIDVLRALHAEFVSRGYRVALTYLPRWYWSNNMGSPDLRGLPPLMSSHYGPGTGRAGDPSTIYPGDNDSGWQGYGGLDVAVFQFTQAATLAGMSIDASAFRGSEEQLRALFGGTPMADTPQLVLDQLFGVNGKGWDMLGRSAIDPTRYNTLVEAVAEIRDQLGGPDHNWGGWSQLEARTLVDAVAQVLENQVNIAARLDRVLALLEGKK